VIESIEARLDTDGSELRALHELVDFSGKAVLEIGCGNGRATWRYADCAASVVAIDPRARDIEQAQQRTPEALRGRVTFVAADAARLELPSGAFDVALFSRSI
jgi:ubiquinone/menaquinone biosynthesis C-methylase UbiE